jgi:hypothetical protein
VPRSPAARVAGLDRLSASHEWRSSYLGVSLKKVVLTCDCGRGGRYDKSALIERTSPDEPGPTLRLKIAAGLGCEAARAILDRTSGLGQSCRIYYPDLLPGK